MIFYFSGTGNSRHAAVTLAARLDTAVLSIPDIIRGKAFRVPSPAEPIGVVFPVYAWAPPEMVLRFVRAHPFPAAAYAFAVCTCGDDAGNAMHALEKARGQRFDSLFSLTMPNNYVIGFDVDPPQVQAQKLAAAQTRLEWIASTVAARGRGVRDVHTGRFARLKTALAAPLFNLGGRRTGLFRAGEACNACGRCAQVCPTANIRMQPRPVWDDDCTGCLACLHHCPHRAIDYGCLTARKGRYVHPQDQAAHETASQGNGE